MDSALYHRVHGERINKQTFAGYNKPVKSYDLHYLVTDYVRED